MAKGKFDEITKLKRKYSRRKMDTLVLERNLINTEIDNRIRDSRALLEKLSPSKPKSVSKRKGRVLTMDKKSKKVVKKKNKKKLKKK